MKLVVFAILLPSVLGIHPNCPHSVPKTQLEFLRNHHHYRKNAVKESDITYSLFLEKNPMERIPLNSSTYDRIDNRYPVKMIFHGWKENSEELWVQNMTVELLRRKPFNVIRVDYSRIANEPYIIASSNVEAVGTLIGKFIIFLQANNYSAEVDRFQLIAYGLGAHIAGNAGRAVLSNNNNTLPIRKITALDPLSFLFECPPLFSNQALNKTDAYAVEVIHTDRTIFGYKETLGTVDFFPNDGIAPQPGCPPLPKRIDFLNLFEKRDDSLLCSHRMSHEYFTSSANIGRFLSIKCNSWSNYTSGACDNNTETLMGNPNSYGYWFVVYGKFYLRTKPDPPYALETYY